MKRQLTLAALLAGATIAAGAVLPAASGGSTRHHLKAEVVPTSTGPIPACDQSCTGANVVNEFIYVTNRASATALTGMALGTGRDTVPNAFVVSSVEAHVYVDGVDTYDSTDTPPPGPAPTFFSGYSGRWPETVTCPPSGPPCTLVGSPAVLPGETSTVLYFGWRHDVTEANGTYVFRFKIHGSYNGSPTTLSASSPPIEMTL
jgi:hypothetical protein